jgi:hypothetical protein
MPGLYLHIGYPKTGTTTLQKHLFATHPEIDYLGKMIPGFHYGIEELGPEIEQLTTATSINYKGTERLRKVIAACRVGMRDKSVLLSSESFVHPSSADPCIVAERAREAFEPCKVIIVIREQRDILRSFYGMHGRFGQYLFVHKDELERLDLPLSIDQWLTYCFSSFERNLTATLHYNRVICLYQKSFGEENVGVFLYEELKHDTARFVTKLCDFMDIDAASAIGLIEGRKENSRITRGELFWSRLSMRLRWNSRSDTLYRRGSRIYDKLLSRMQAESDVIPADWEARIRDTYAVDNLALEEVSGLPLTEYGYFT